MTKIIYLTWQVEEAHNFRQEYIGGGEYKTLADYHKVTKRARWENYSPASLVKARAYIAENMQDERENVRAVVVEETD